ncbi:MAG: hypoxanthine phosphoribosyltransferase [Propionibacteriaceae bacterium]|nr:hypoxanthine phosphoribosyltransferase [Propionibacteriaceae bacterium]
MEIADVRGDLSEVLFTPEQIQARLRELAAEVDRDYAGRDLLIVGVLNGAVMTVADFARHLKTHCEMQWMAMSSYGDGVTSSGVLRILKDLNDDIAGRHVLVVEDIIDTGLTLSYLIQNLRHRGPASLEVLTAFRKPGALRCQVDVKYIGFDIPNDFVVGYGLDYAGKYRNLSGLGVLDPTVYQR